MITFDLPQLLLLLALIPPALFATYGWKARGGRIPLSFTIWDRDRFQPPLLLYRFLLFLGALSLWIGIAALIIALAGPRIVEREKIYLHRGVDIMFVLDTSPSMAARDFSEQTRFDEAKEAIRKFVDGREHDPAGLVAFGSEAVLITPPTLDYEAFHQRLDTVKLLDLGQGTAIGLGIAVATVHLEKSSASRKVIVLVSDGENNAGEITPESASLVAASLDIRIYAIGAGGDGPAPLEFRDPESGTLYSGTYEGSVDIELLEQLADQTGGRAFLAGTAGSLTQVFQEVDTLESVELRVATDVHSTPMHRTMIYLGLALLVFHALVHRIVFREVW
jgi:Ca-activated chloride channel homolog